MCTESFPAEHRRDPQGLTTSICVCLCVCVRARAGGVGQRSLWTEDKGCSSWKIRADYLRLWWLVKENWHAKKCLILRIRMSGYVFFCWPGEVPCLPGPIINLVRGYFSLWLQILYSPNQGLLVQRTVLGKSCPAALKKYLPGLDQTTHITSPGCLDPPPRWRLSLLACLQGLLPWFKFLTPCCIFASKEKTLCIG